MRKSVRRKPGEKGTGMAELAILLPFLLVTFLGATDLSRMIYAQQTLADLTREAANLVSRGADIQQALAALAYSQGTVDTNVNGAVIISRIRRRSGDDPKPWIYEQVQNGGGASSWGKVGSLNGYATIPNVTSLPNGVVMTAVEIVAPYEPIFELPKWGLDFYPERLYDVAFF